MPNAYQPSIVQNIACIKCNVIFYINIKFHEGEQRNMREIDTSKQLSIK